jgi:hypothetical protein
MSKNKVNTEIKLRKLDLDNEFSFYQGDYGKGIYSELLEKLNKIKSKIEGKNAEDVSSLMLNVIDAKMKIEILSLIYTIDGQDWSLDVFEQLKEYFATCKNPKVYTGDIKSFFIFITKFITEDLELFSSMTQARK